MNEHLHKVDGFRSPRKNSSILNKKPKNRISVNRLEKAKAFFITLAYFIFCVELRQSSEICDTMIEFRLLGDDALLLADYNSV